MKKCIVILLALAFVVSMAGSALAESKLEKILASGKITLATSPDYAPYEFIDPTKTGPDMYVGADLALGRYIAEALGVELVIEAMDFSAVQGAVTTGKVDVAISGFAYTNERAESMGLSIFFNFDRDENQQGLLVRKEGIDNYATLEDFAGKKVAAQNASLQLNLLTEYIPDAKVELITNLNDAIMMLITGKVDAVGVSKDNGVAFAANYSEIVMSNVYYERQDEGNVLAVTKGEDDLLEKLNEILAEVNELGLYETWKEEAVALAGSLGLDTEE